MQTTTASTVFPAVTVSAAGYTATLATDGTVDITNEQSQWVGRGKFTGESIVECAANIPENAYEALETELFFAV